MNDSDFDTWLAANGANSTNGRATRKFAVRTIEQRLQALGSPYDDLDKAWEADRFASLVERIGRMKADARAGGQDYRILMPGSEQPLNRLASWSSWLKQYGRFLSGGGGKLASDADRIRQHVLEHYIEPAREAERETVDVLVRDVNTALGLNQGWPNICQALTGSIFCEMADVSPPKRTGAEKSSATIFHFDLGGTASIDQAALNRFKARFLSAFPDFSSFDRPSSFSAQEDDYKRALIARAAEITALGAPDLTAMGGSLLDLLAGNGGLESNLLGWRMAGGLRSARAKHPGVIERATADMVRASDPIAGVEAFLDVCWPLLSEGQKSMPYGDSRTIPTMVAALVRPEDMIGLRYQPFHTVGVALLHRSLFANARLSSAELGDAISMSQAILAAMNDWGWAPRDLWDVQGFIWVVAQDDNALLARFDVNAGFKAMRASWSRQQSAAFCRIAHATHDAGLDWWFVGIAPYQLRFGRNSAGRARAEAVLGYVEGSPASISFNRRENIIDIGIADGLSLGQSELFETALAAVGAKIVAWLPPTPPRPGRWPDEFSPEINDASATKDSKVMTPPDPTNLILYGPPGTGKTYNTAREAVRLCDGDTPYAEDADGRAALMERYGELCRKKRISFVTFHQNFSYEDFVEGLRPISGSADGEPGSASGFSLQAQDGIFKQIAELAASNRGKTIGDAGALIDRTRTIFKMSLGRSREAEDDVIYQDAIEGGYVVLGWGGDVDWSDPRFDDFPAIKERWREDEPDAHGNNANIAQTYTFRANMQIGSLVVISDGNRKFRAIGQVTGPYQFVAGRNGDYNHRRAVRWLWHSDESLPAARIYGKDLSQVSAYQMNSRLVDWDALEQVVAGGGEVVATTGAPEPYVLIIDEINRANISNVFGELITLIEPDKRIDKANALKVTLPYSKTEFGVPANLHIVGTMNTADRSIALLDTALRRRFTFREMAPRLDLLKVVDDIDLSAVLRSMNDRIEYLVDREHRIGHAFFIGCRDSDEIDAVMRDKVIPLLQEYFFEDWSGIRAVLGSGFIGSRKLKAPPDFDGDDRESWFVRLPFGASAYATLINGAALSDDADDETVKDE